MPRDQRVLAVRDVVYFEVSAGIGLSVVRRGTDDYVSRHFSVNITKQRHNARLVELKRALFALGPGAEIVSFFFVPSDGGPEYVVLDAVVVLKVNRGTHLHYENGGIEL